jgi:hypothetical protein
MAIQEISGREENQSAPRFGVDHHKQQLLISVGFLPGLAEDAEELRSVQPPSEPAGSTLEERIDELKQTA